jgi:putative peptidoglycan lipid II flippase
VNTPGGSPPADPVTTDLPARTRAGLARSAGLIGVATMTSRVLALVREQVLAYYFGAGNAVDAYNVAFRIPNLVRDLFAEGAMSAAFVPTFTRTLTTQGRDAAWRLGRHVITALLVATGVLVVLGIVFARPLVTAFAGSFGEVPGKLELTVFLTRLMLPFLMMVALAAACMGMLNSLNRFFLPALSPAMFNVGSLACLLALTPFMGHLGLPAITAAAIGVLVGGMGQAALQWPMLRREGFRYRPALDWRDPGLQRVLILMGPGTLGLAATQINVFVNTVLATGEGTGAVSWLNYAFRLMYLPLGIIGVSIATAAIPAISRHAARNDLAGVRKEVASGLSMMLLLNIPATLGLIVLARPIVALLFERGQFTPADTEATALALACYAIGLTGYSAVKIASPTFYALHESRTPVLVSMGSVAVNVALNLVLVRHYSYYGLAIGTSIAALLNALVLLGLLRRRLGGLEAGRLLSVLVRTMVAALIMAGAAWAIEGFLGDALPGRSLVARGIQVGGAIAGALVVLAVTSRLLGLREFFYVIGAVLGRVLPKKR